LSSSGTPGLSVVIQASIAGGGGCGPSSCCKDRRLSPCRGEIEAIVAVQRVGLQNGGIAAEMPLGMLPRSIARGVEQRRRRILAVEWPIVADIHPNPPGFRLAFREDRYGGVVPVQPLGRKHVGLDQRMQRTERRGAGPHLVGQRQQAQVDALAR
jgi:hypothetical protein